MRHYQVISPSMWYYEWNAPSDDFQCWGYYLAKNAKDAIRQAVADKEAFGEWVNEQRASGQPPFKGLKASLCLCPHGVCWGCIDSDGRTNCPECEKAFQAEDEAIWFEQGGAA